MRVEGDAQGLKHTAMRIQGTNGFGFAPARPAIRPDGGRFSLDAGPSTLAASASALPRGITGIDALVALQSFEEPAEKRRRATKRGYRLLDTLEELKLALLGGQIDAAALGRLKSAVLESQAGSGDAALDDLLAQIDLRAQVEIAKLRPRTAV